MFVAIKGITALGYVVWFAHMTLILYRELQAEKKSVSEAMGFWFRALTATLLVITIIIY